MYRHFDEGLIDFDKQPKRVVASQLAHGGCAQGDYEQARRTFYKRLHNGSFLPPTMKLGHAWAWDRELVRDFVDSYLHKDATGRWYDIRDPDRVIPICPGFYPKHECEAHLEAYRSTNKAA